MRKFEFTVSKQNNLDAIKYNLGVADVYDDRAAEKSNQLACIIPLQYIDEDGKRSVTSYAHEDCTLAMMMKKKLNKREVLCLLGGIASAYEIGAQGIPVSYIIKDTNYVYVNKESLAVKCMIVPVKQDAMALTEMPVFFRDIVANMMFDETDTDNYVARLLSVINAPDFSVSSLKTLIESELDSMGVQLAKNGGMVKEDTPAQNNANNVKVNKLGVMAAMANQQMNQQMGMPQGMPPQGMMMGQPQGMPPQGMPPMGQVMQAPQGMPIPPMGAGAPQPMGQAPQPMGAGAPAATPLVHTAPQPKPQGMPQPPMGAPAPAATPLVHTAPQPMGAPIPAPQPMGQAPKPQGMPQPPMGAPAPAATPLVHTAPQPMGAPAQAPQPKPQGMPVPPMGAGAPQPKPQGMPVPPMGQAPQPKPQGMSVPPMGQAPQPKPQGMPQPPMGAPAATPLVHTAPQPKPQGMPVPQPMGQAPQPMGQAPQPMGQAPQPKPQGMPIPPMGQAPQPAPAPAPQPKPQGMPVPQMGQAPQPMGAQAPAPKPQGMPQPAPFQQAGQGTLMGQLGSKPVPHIIRKKTGEIIYIDKPEFSIGKSKTKADYPLEDNSAISRVHCIIVQKGGVNYIKDNNSTNHTFLNGVELVPDTEVLLKHKSVIQMGDEEFTFLLRKGD